jgi:hypothetical protein
MPQAGRQTNKRFSLTDLADDDEPIVRMDLMSPTLVPSPATAPESVAVETSVINVVEEPITSRVEPTSPAEPASAPASVPSTTRSTGSRVSRQSREVAAALDPVQAQFANQKESFYSNFGERTTKKQISLRIHPSVDKALTKEVLTKNLEGITVTREAIITKAICNFLGIDYPEDM